MSNSRAANWVCSPPPCGEGVGVGVMSEIPAYAATPLPNPPPQGGREHTEFAASVLTNLTQTLFG